MAGNLGEPAAIIAAMGDRDAVAAEARRAMRLLSVVAPVFDEEKVLAEFHRRLAAALAGIEYELILVDDGSSDGSPRIMRELAVSDPRVRVVELSRNFGHQAALTAGLDRARGDAVACLDSDLQDPPELLTEMLERWRDGADVVYAVRRSREGESRFKLVSARGFYRVFSRLARMDPEAASGDFRLLDRRAVDVLKAMPERNRFLRGMTVWVGFTQTAVPYDRDPRYAGETKYTLRRMLRFSIDAIASFSHVPLQLATLLGFTFSLVAFLGIPVAIGFRIAGQFVPGVTSILLAVLLLGGIQLITLGIVGEYIGRIYEEVKGRPLYVVRGEIAGGGEDRQTRA
jgi:dolichol-phosphate mannosyltransferase